MSAAASISHSGVSVSPPMSRYEPWINGTSTVEPGGWMPSTFTPTAPSSADGSRCISPWGRPTFWRCESVAGSKPLSSASRTAWTAAAGERVAIASS